MYAHRFSDADAKDLLDRGCCFGVFLEDLFGFRPERMVYDKNVGLGIGQNPPDFIRHQALVNGLHDCA